ncbi:MULTISPECIES: phosphate ABC transporter permease PstA [unclassified Paenarthrobacter]|uniref:phosphate ABC transporter permease PstA n=1 Tax=unclassified Paenarthrobacter TaxID=2634190 RepID=UPI00084EA393|nr:phosphate ABC transporter permease PstA [Paenarthrobacter sp. R1]NKR11163.1 phosphate ABC transporter, permease protein PstA [Arthrobacter sp. M5]NKR14441.1 phosphate ABC transporter, permease protein PstA [Arthrobacter sp. M6]OEH62166.1 phosphate ABC transporter, permease protein PstA [Arthrobacter sp. D4]OEH63611.1 phosphate ABC transporter, permease protein PstA [Arthrobacter sp. D2]WIV29252.1 phosphate ABC transporter permease PstA [Paenarthrobacter sp. R1]
MTQAQMPTEEQMKAKRALLPISRGRRFTDKFAGGLVTAAFLIALVPLLWVLWTVLSKGFPAITNGDWWSKSLQGVLPEQFAGGVYHALYGTLVQAFMAALIAVPLGLLIAIYLVEYGRGVLARVTTQMVDIMSGIPSIVAALFIFSLWVATFGQPQSAFAVSLALVLLMLPVVVRNTEEMLRLVPDELREASYALGVPKWITILRIVLPSAMSGIISGIILAIARVMGETAPVLVLVGYSRSINFNIFDGNMASLPLLLYTELINPEEAGQLRVWGAALTLIIVIAVLNLIAAAAARLAAPKKS